MEHALNHYDEKGDLNVGIIGQQLEKDVANMPDNGFRFKQDEVWNSAIDAAMKVLDKKLNKTETGADHLLKMIVSEFITELNSLRK